MWDRLRHYLPALPYPHFMAFAPLDCWARLLLGTGAIKRIPARYWVRVAGGLCTSAMGTVLTLPERVVLSAVWRLTRGRGDGDLRERGGSGRGARAKPTHCSLPRGGGEGGPVILVVLGYYRSGTTHLHYVLSCDPGSVTPRWYQALAPQGFAISWLVLRHLLVPFLSSKRPQDDVAYGPDYPAEDDFAVCNTNCACAMPGRMVLPGEWEHYKRFHGLDGLSAAERARFDQAQRGFTWRLEALNPGKRILLKTPSHTARVKALMEVYGERVKFVHISREAGAVVKSNVAMHRRFEPFLLQDHPGDAEIAQRVIAEYDQTERAFLRDVADAGPGRVARMRYEDLIADPMSEIARVYRELGLELSEAARGRMVDYLRSVKAYRTASERAPKVEKRAGEAAAPLDGETLAWMHKAFGHDRPAMAKRELEAEGVAGGGEKGASTAPKSDSGAIVALITALWCVALWLLAASVMRDRMDWLLWPSGVAIGMAALRSAKGGRGRLGLGIWCAVLTVLVMGVVALPATWVADYWDARPVPWEHVWLSTRRGVLAMNNWVWVVLGVLSAYRYGSREHVRPPGM